VPATERPAKALEEERAAEFRQELKWQEILADFAEYKARHWVAFQLALRGGIPTSARSRVWLYLLHPGSEQLDHELRPQASKRGKRAKSGKNSRAAVRPLDAWSKRLRHYEKLSVVDTSGLLVSPYLANPADADVPRIVTAYVNTRAAVPYSPAMGYAASLFLSFMPPGRAFTALWQLMRRNHMSIAFTDPGIAELSAVWGELLKKQSLDLASRLSRLGIGAKDFLVPWAQSLFLSIPFTSELTFRFIDRIIDRGLRAFFEIALMIVVSLQKTIESGSHDAVLAALTNPATDSFFEKWTTVIKRLDEYVVTREDYKRYCPDGRTVTDANKKRNQGAGELDDEGVDEVEDESSG
jgi:hypothetical protein